MLGSIPCWLQNSSTPIMHWLSTQFDFTLLDLMVGGHHGDRSQLCETRRAQCTALTSFIGCFCLPLFMEFFAAQHCSFRNKADSYRPIWYVAVKTECRKSRYVLSCLVFQSPSTVSGLVASKVASWTIFHQTVLSSVSFVALSAASSKDKLVHGAFTLFSHVFWGLPLTRFPGKVPSMISFSKQCLDQGITVIMDRINIPRWIRKGVGYKDWVWDAYWAMDGTL